MTSCSVSGVCPVTWWMMSAKSSRKLLWRRIRCGPYLQERAWSRCTLSGALHVLVVVVLWHLVGWGVCGMSRRILAAVANSSSVSGMMSLMGAWSQAPEPVPLVEWWTPIALGFSALVRVVMWSFRTSEVSCFCWCLRVMVSGGISVMSCHRAGSTLLVAVWSCALVLGSSFRSSPMVLWPV